MKKKVYERPELVRRGDIESLTQGFGSLGSGDWIFEATDGKVGKEGCLVNGSPLCSFS